MPFVYNFLKHTYLTGNFYMDIAMSQCTTFYASQISFMERDWYGGHILSAFCYVKHNGKVSLSHLASTQFSMFLPAMKR